MYSNINPNSYIKNKDFKNRILKNEIDPDNISNIHIYDIYP